MADKHQVLALHSEHPDMTCAEIAEEIGACPEYVYSTPRRAGIKPQSRRQKRPVESCSRTIVVSRDTLGALAPHAEARGMTVNALCRALLGAVADDNLVGALLDG